MIEAPRGRRTSGTSAWLLMVGILLLGCVPALAAGGSGDFGDSGDLQPAARARVVDPVLIPITGPIADRQAEISGMTWMGDTLVVLPQDPTVFAAGDNLGFFAFKRSTLEAAIAALLAGESVVPLEPHRAECHAPGLSRVIRGFDGLEAMAIVGDACYMTVEAKEDTAMAGYLVCGHYDMVNETVRVDMTRLTGIPLGLNIHNIAEESILIDGERIITLSEANGANLTDDPRAKVFNLATDYQGSLPFPQIEYRVTDATALDADGRFWVVNYFFPPERAKLQPADDPEVARHGTVDGVTAETCVERLLELRLQGDEIVRTDTPPIYLALDPDGCRNWEAIVRLGDAGFLLMTDKYPGTLFAFVPDPFTH